MQSTDKTGRVVDTRIFEKTEKGLPDPAELIERMRQAQEKGAVKHVIANMPQKGETVEINGLKYLVRGVNNENGSLHLKIITPGE